MVVHSGRNLSLPLYEYICLHNLQVEVYFSMVFKDWLSFLFCYAFALRFLFLYSANDLCEVIMHPWMGYQLQNEVFTFDQMFDLCFLR